ncbi:hypothetical protein RB653_003543 [Dictyostelium firmibasis]|uniref:ABC transporter domain-containing protein n=1 Tax=Dictyostelium firmibasis TaxID=79012 RepID=A0AAN7YZ74_9MYCE
MGEFKSQLLTLLKKNSLLKGKSKIKFIGEILAPMVVIGILFGLLYLSAIIQPDFSPRYASGFTETVARLKKLLVATNGSLTPYQLRIVYNLKRQIKLAHPEYTDEYIDLCFEYFNNFESMEGYFLDPENYRGVMGGLWFDENDYYYSPPSVLKYSISVDADYTNDNNKQISERSDSQIYLRHSFTQIQTAVDQAILMTQNVEIPMVVMGQRFPNPYVHLWQTWTDGRKMILKETGGIFISAAIFVGLFTTITNMVMEKESKILEAMKIMGLHSLPYYVSIAISSCYTIIPSTAIVIAVLKGTQLIWTTQWYILAIILLLFSLSLILLAFILSKFFNRSKFAGLVCFLIILIMAGLGILVNHINVSTSVKLIFCLLSPVSISLANYSMSMKDLELVGVENPDWSVIVSENQIIGMLILDVVLYATLVWYIDNIISGEFGQSKPFYFFLTKSYWSKKSDQNKLFDFDQQTIESPLNNRKKQLEYNNNQDFEFNEIHSSKATIQIRKLRKEFKTGDGKRVAVDDLTIDMYQNRIHCFLGPNGSGKSTTIGMLTGLLTCTSGSALINGLDINQNIDMIRKNIGVVLQQDIIWDNLTVLEHLIFYAQLKGYSDLKEAKNEAKKMGIEVGLEIKLHSKAGTLSGGQKRKLCLGIAFIGPNSNILFLDEVTSGLDPLSRSEVQDFILSKKEGKTIILSTHYLDEADLLGDTISIIAHGKLKCNGSPLFLKNRFGVGYLLTITKKSGEFSKDSVMEITKQYINQAQVLSDAGTELSIRLPMESLPMFSQYFKHLEDSKDLLLIDSYGISISTLEEVFLKIGQETLKSTPNFNDQAVKEALSTKSSGIKVRQQLKGLLIKRFCTTKKDFKSFMFSIVVPLIILGLGLVMYKNMRTITTFNDVTTPLTFSIDVYGDNIYVPWSVSGQNSTIDLRIKNSIGKSNHSILLPADELEDYLIENYEGNPGAFSFGKTIIEGNEMLSFTAYFNRDYLHALPIYINFVDNALSMNLGGVGIQTTSRPFQHIRSQFELATEKINFSAIIFFIILTLAAFALVVASHAGNISQERAARIKRLLYISGLKKYVYWLSNLIWDYILTFIMVIFLAVLVVAIDDKFRNQFPLFICALVLFVTAIIPLSYLFSYAWSSHGKATGFIFGIHFGIGLLMTVACFILRIWVIKDDNDTIQTITDIIDLVFFFFSPFYCFSKVMVIITNFPGTTRLGESYIANYWGIKFGLPPVCFLAVHTIVWTIWIMILDYYPELRGKYRHGKTDKAPPPPPDEDSDVSNERSRVLSFETSNDPIIMRDFFKLYKGKGKEKDNLAVHNTSLAIPKGQTFGLLGLNGAGKSTTLGCLSGEVIPSGGDIFVNGYNIQTQRLDALSSVGFCHQYNSLIGLLSAREQIRLYCRIKGIEESKIEETVEAFIKMMDLGAIGNSNVAGYSGGNKRKVALSVAIVGNPSVVYLDEVSVGVDAVVARFMWNVITELKKDKVIILTTHSMMECSAVCDRLTIMKSGKMMCLGSIQHIKDKFGSGYSIDVKFKKEYHLTGVKLFQKELPNATLVDNHDLSASFELPNSLDAPIQLSKIFSVIERNLKPILDDYSVGQTSIDHIFLKLTNLKQQKFKNQQKESIENHTIDINNNNSKKSNNNNSNKNNNSILSTTKNFGSSNFFDVESDNTYLNNLKYLENEDCDIEMPPYDNHSLENSF